MDDSKIRQQVREFYNQIGWQSVSEGMYQNARYEDLRPVSRGYIHRCHLRVGQYLKSKGKLMLDAGSGPVQYQEYLAYSEGFTFRVCVDISILALQEARKRIGERGLYVVADVSCLPFKAEIFEGEVSLHTLHHLPISDQVCAYKELFRVLSPGCNAVVVNGWSYSPLMRQLNWLVVLVERVQTLYSRLRVKRATRSTQITLYENDNDSIGIGDQSSAVGTYVQKMDAMTLKDLLKEQLPFEVKVWRSVSVHFLRTLVHPYLGGRFWLAFLYWLEERFPHYFGEKGQYPLIILRKD